MTSIMHPALYASRMATAAQEQLGAASATLLDNHVKPIRPADPNRIGIPEENGPDSPDNPWFVRPDQPVDRYGVAAHHATNAIGHIDQVLRMNAGDMLSRDVLHAFTRAKEQAEVGVGLLTSPATRPVTGAQVALTFDGAGLWLGLAKSLIELDQRPAPGPRPMHPPVTTMPVPEVEAPEAMAR